MHKAKCHRLMKTNKKKSCRKSENDNLYKTHIIYSAGAALGVGKMDMTPLGLSIVYSSKS